MHLTFYDIVRIYKYYENFILCALKNSKDSKLRKYEMTYLQQLISLQILNCKYLQLIIFFSCLNETLIIED